MPRVPRLPAVGRTVRTGGGADTSDSAADDEVGGVSTGGVTGTAAGGAAGVGAGVGFGADDAGGGGGGIGAGGLGLVSFAHNACKPIIAIIHIARTI